MSKATTTAAAQLVRLVVPAGKATAAPPVGPALGARGVKSIDFVKEFNARTSSLTPGTPTPVKITIQPDRTFTFTIQSPPTSYLIRQAAGIEIGSGTPNKAAGGTIAGTISLKAVYEIAKLKQADQGLKGAELESIARSIVGSCKSAGVQVVP
ncbi:BZ3500_MvSof-1268-A1-R1_Chr2-1g04371 [Microbotryum saponariae]|uniref:Large ribosomal subunit protein uL11m n=1 Tax=Microbotryum saponariae TaxID=289078 RepID=A0A2X0KAJ1_9BASI|nr:BZ3500_MvSof-1268-A1-R1_Chr2-1g04371 [Microbotryum saponariae]SCZ91575.1 BZ3501_MvSof-1269-A2-R1_Chr2-1g04027 [Microbotryum saponariae]